MAIALSGRECRLHPETDFQEDEVMPLTLSKATLTEGSRPSFEAGRKLGVVEMALVWKILHEEPQCPSRVVLDTVAQSQVPIAVSAPHPNRLRAKWNLTRRKRHPGQTAPTPRARST